MGTGPSLRNGGGLLDKPGSLAPHQGGVDTQGRRSVGMADARSPGSPRGTPGAFSSSPWVRTAVASGPRSFTTPTPNQCPGNSGGESGTASRGDGAGGRRGEAQGRSVRTRPWEPTWARPSGSGQLADVPHRTVHLSSQPYVPAQSRPHEGSSTAGTVVKVLVGITVLGVCGGYWLTGGTIVDPSDSATEPPRLRNQADKWHMLELINQARVTNGEPPVRDGDEQRRPGPGRPTPP